MEASAKSSTPRWLISNKQVEAITAHTSTGQVTWTHEVTGEELPHEPPKKPFYPTSITLRYSFCYSSSLRILHVYCHRKGQKNEQLNWSHNLSVIRMNEWVSSVLWKAFFFFSKKELWRGIFFSLDYDNRLIRHKITIQKSNGERWYVHH